MKQEFKYEGDHKTTDDNRVTVIVNVARVGILSILLSMLMVLPAIIGYFIGIVTLIVAILLALRWYLMQQRFK